MLLILQKFPLVNRLVYTHRFVNIFPFKSDFLFKDILQFSYFYSFDTFTFLVYFHMSLLFAFVRISDRNSVNNQICLMLNRIFGKAAVKIKTKHVFIKLRKLRKISMIKNNKEM